jgi:hypothetical protein
MRSMVEGAAPDLPERPEFRMEPFAFALTPPPPSAVPGLNRLRGEDPCFAQRKRGRPKPPPQTLSRDREDQNLLVALNFQVRPRPLAVNGS